MENDRSFSINYPLNILIAANHTHARYQTEQALSSLGYRPDLAASGNEVISMTDHKAYDVILVDIGMAGQDGTLTNRLAHLRENNRPLVIGMSGDEQTSGVRQFSLEAGMDHFFSNPMDSRELRLQLKACAILTGNCRIRA
jgi:CheY-like chemotaxis protein